MDKFIMTGFSDEIHENFDIQLQSIKDLAINFIEIRGVDGKNISSYTLEEVQNIKDKLDIYQIKVSAIGSPIGKIFINESFVDHLELFKHTIEIARILDTRYIRIFSFFIPKADSPDIYRDEVIRRLRLLVDIAKASGIILLHENEKDIYGDTDLRCLELVKQINSEYFKLIFDFANFVQCNVDTLRAYTLLKDYISYFHIKDALFINKMVVPPGSGDGKLYEILNLAYRFGYKGFTSIEPHLGYFKGLKELELGLKLEEIAENGFEKFKLAYDELKKIINKIYGGSND